MLCDPTDLIWRKGTPFEAMTGHTAPSSYGLLAKVFLVVLNPNISEAMELLSITLPMMGNKCD